MDSTRRQVLAAGGGLAGLAFGGRVLADVSSTDPPGGWPMARGTPGGRSAAPSASPPTEDVAVRWKRSFDSRRGFRTEPSPVVAGVPDGAGTATVYAAGDDLVGLDAATGRRRFAYNYAPAAVSPPAVAAAAAYEKPTVAVVKSGGLRGLHAGGGHSVFGSRVGTERWVLRRSADGAGGFDQLRTQPVAADGTVFASPGGSLVAVDASSGRPRWTVPIDVHRPAVRNGTVYAAAYGRGVLGFDAATGDRTFRATVGGARAQSVTATPDGLIIATDEGLARLGYDGATRWRYEPDDLSRDGGGVAVAGGSVYAGFEADDRTHLVAVAIDGHERWASDAAPPSAPWFPAPAVAADTVYTPLADRGLAAVDAADGSVRWRFGTDGPAGPWSPPALAGELVFTVGDGRVWALEER